MRVPQVSDRLKEIPAQALRGVFAGIGQLLLITDKLRNKTPAGTGVPRARTLEPAETAPEQTVPEETVTVTDTAAESVAVAPEAAPVTTETPKEGKASKTSAAPQGSATAETASTARVPKARDFDKTGNVRLLGGADVAARAAGKTAKTGKAAQASAPAEAGPVADSSSAVEASPGADASSAVEASPGADASSAAEAADGPGDSGPPLPNFDELTVPSLRARLRNLDIAQVRRMLEYEQTHGARPEVITMFERRIAKLEAEA
jgi:hypothetical protein